MVVPPLVRRGLLSSPRYLSCVEAGRAGKQQSSARAHALAHSPSCYINTSLIGLKGSMTCARLTPLRSVRVHAVQVVENTYQGYGEGAYAHSLAQEDGSQPHLRPSHGTIIGTSPRRTRDQASSFELSALRAVSPADISVPSDRSSRIQSDMRDGSDSGMHVAPCGPIGPSGVPRLHE